MKQKMNTLKSAVVKMVEMHREGNENVAIFQDTDGNYDCHSTSWEFDTKVLDNPIDSFGALHPDDATDEELADWIVELVNEQ